MYGQLDIKLIEHQQLHQQKEQQLEERGRQKLNKVESKAADQISNLAKQNAEILFGPMETADGQQMSIDGQQEAVLNTLADKEQTAGRKERKRLQREREAIRKEGVDTVRQRLEQQLDEQITAAYQTEQADYEFDFHTETLEQMKVNICGDYGVAPEVRQTHLQRFEAMEAQSAKLKERYTKTAFASKVLRQKLGTQAEAYIAKKMQILDGERAALEDTLNRYRDEYNAVFHGALATEQQVDRYNQRVATYQQNANVLRSGAEREIQRRAMHPATLEHLPQVLEEYKQNKVPRAVQKDKYGNPIHEITYQKQMDAIMESVNQKLAADSPPQPPITQKEAEELVKQYLKDLLAKNDFRFRCSGEVFGLVVDDKMKNQMETGTSGGANNAPLRMAFTEKSFGNAVGSLDKSEYENYGYMASPVLASINRSRTAGYGSVAVKLNKARMAGRVTCTVGDSLNKMRTCNPSLASDPDLACVGFHAKEAFIMSAYQRYRTEGKKPGETDADLDMESVLARVNKDIPATERGKITEYLELQYHGDVTVRDMEEITVTKPPVIIKVRPDGMKETKKQAEVRTNDEFLNSLFKIRVRVGKINANPEQYGRAGMPPLRINLVSGVGPGAIIRGVKPIAPAKDA
ncbi:MAG: hypothetical protein HFE97_11865 [Oscillospiraceae bacterium]|nr:hypothetical protein [Oscillospiraceae bacterium]